MKREITLSIMQKFNLLLPLIFFLLSQSAFSQKHFETGLYLAKAYELSDYSNQNIFKLTEKEFKIAFLEDSDKIKIKKQLSIFYYNTAIHPINSRLKGEIVKPLTYKQLKGIKKNHRKLKESLDYIKEKDASVYKELKEKEEILNLNIKKISSSVRLELF